MNEEKILVIQNATFPRELHMVCCSPFSGDTVLEIQQLPTAPSLAFGQFDLLMMSPLKHVPNETSTALSVSERVPKC